MTRLVALRCLVDGLVALLTVANVVSGDMAFGLAMAPPLFVVGRLGRFGWLDWWGGGLVGSMATEAVGWCARGRANKRKCHSKWGEGAKTLNKHVTKPVRTNERAQGNREGGSGRAVERVPRAHTC